MNVHGENNRKLHYVVKEELKKELERNTPLRYLTTEQALMNRGKLLAKPDILGQHKIPNGMRVPVFFEVKTGENGRDAAKSQISGFYRSCSGMGVSYLARYHRSRQETPDSYVELEFIPAEGSGLTPERAGLELDTVIPLSRPRVDELCRTICVDEEDSLDMILRGEAA